MINADGPKLTKFATRSSKPVAKSGPLVRVRKFNFTKKIIDALPTPAGEQRAYYHDTQVRGLTIAVSPTGRRTLVLYRKVAGRPERITLGVYPDLTIEQARGMAEEMNSAITRGENPADHRRTIRAEDTLGELWARFLAEHANGKRTADQMTNMWRLHLAAWSLRKLSTITHSDVVRLHTQIGRTRGKYAANRVVEMLSSMFTQAQERWNWRGENPAEKVQAFRETKRKRFLQPDELPKFFCALADEPNETIRDYILLSLVTGARRGNTQAARWNEINFERATWTIPRTKNDEPLDVPLTEPALSLLERRKATSTSEWVFPAKSASGHLEEPKKAWARILHRAGIKDLRLHDLRRTFGAYQACAGSSLPIIGESLGHKSLAATAVYARLSLQPVRASVTRAVDTMLLAGGSPLLLSRGK